MEVKPKRMDDGSVFGITIDGKFKPVEFIIQYRPEMTSWLHNMLCDIDGEKWNSPEYSDSPLLTEEILNSLCIGATRYWGK